MGVPRDRGHLFHAPATPILVPPLMALMDPARHTRIPVPAQGPPPWCKTPRIGMQITDNIGTRGQVAPIRRAVRFVKDGLIVKVRQIFKARQIFKTNCSRIPGCSRLACTDGVVRVS